MAYAIKMEENRLSKKLETELGCNWQRGRNKREGKSADF